jgi:hypothetical protein
MSPITHVPVHFYSRFFPSGALLLLETTTLLPSVVRCARPGRPCRPRATAGRLCARPRPNLLTPPLAGHALAPASDSCEVVRPPTAGEVYPRLADPSPSRLRPTLTAAPAPPLRVLPSRRAWPPTTLRPTEPAGERRRPEKLLRH